MKPVALIKCGGTLPQTVPVHGDFEEWFAHALGDTPVQQVDVFRGESPLKPSEYSAALVTGSVSMVSERADWSEATAEWLRRALDQGLPALGVCYGHQLMAHALGGTVGSNPKGRQIGTRPCHLLPAAHDDNLMGRLPDEFPVQTSHLEAVLELPEGAVRLAETPLDPNFALRFGETAWGVQFHPEFSDAVMRDYIRIRGSQLREEGLSPDELLAAVRPTPVAASLLTRFAALVSQHALSAALA